MEDKPEYNTWYSDWMKVLAKNYTKKELERMLGVTAKELTNSSNIHLKAITKTSSMTSNSQKRAQARNTVSATGDKAIAITGALEIYKFYPEYTKEGK